MLEIRFILKAMSVLVLTVVAVSASAEVGVTPTEGELLPLSGSSAPPQPNNIYGTSEWQELVVGSAEMVPLSDSQWESTDFATGGYTYRSGGSNSGACTSVHLPNGARVSGITVFLRDSSATGYMQTYFKRANFWDDSGETLFDYSTDTAGTPGWVKTYIALPGGDHTVDNNFSAYSLCTFQWVTTGNSLGHKGAVIWWKRQISPAPATATFTDVPTDYWAFQGIEALAASGITQGCGGSNFCPDDNVTRAQMATFLARALGLHWHLYP